MGEFERNVAGIGTLAEPMRRELYLYVCAQPAAVSRDQAADAVGIARHQAKFHLDRLEAEGLLESDYARMGGRSGPGAGRPAKLYRRSGREIAVSLPSRSYEQAGLLMADAIADSAATGRPILESLHDAAATHGAQAGADAKTGRRGAIGSAFEALSENGFEPRRDGDRIVLLNCPFHALAAAHTELICGMNKAYVSALVDALGHDELETRLDAGPGRCCVTIARKSQP
ncbi:helix-turn-helix transcriptional regulator [Fodinicola acaciae]|uniref:helix-turn-helix transcriptional regulator n=1 Tax=Fodinicola acaciae TaxID=2681555 RepID=UPI0013D82BA2|nr:helix-turn-helix domain-containing protein [Fodinicola acaciae]